ncbi:MAG TPA: hypothetical protein VFC39_20495 [Acidobacteriaceae bacterium]|nr:hypothetical protein [Acidobacteriaceae bacterium]
MRTNVCFFGACILSLAGSFLCAAQAPSNGFKVNVRYEDPIRNENYPELLYWFVTPETIVPPRYSRDIQHIAHDTVFDFPFLTARNGVNFFTSPAAHDAVAEIVKEGHQNGLRIGATLEIQNIDSMRKFSFDDEQTGVSDGETTLDANGRGVIESSLKLRSSPAQKTEVLRVFVFRKTGDGEYDPATLTDVTAKVVSKSPQPGSISVTVDLGPRFSGYTAFCMATTWFRALDLFSDAYRNWVHEAIDDYRDVPFDGTALDEFSYTKIPMTPTAPYRGQFAGRAFSAHFEQGTGRTLTQTLFETRYAPAGHPEVRIRAIDEYWDFLRKGPLQIEQEFYRYSRQVFGDKNFAGIHDTFHNHLTNDEAWATGINWWTIPRQYGMSDEDLSLPLRMGLLVAHPGNIMYDQFYGSDIHRFAVKAMNDARFDARLHYHGYNDTGRWGADLSTDAFLSKQNPVERKIRLLNQFDPAAPELPLLVVFGMPSLLDWYPHESARNIFDVNGSLHIEEKVQAIWGAGYRCAVVPSDLIDNGALKLDAKDRPVLHGHTFHAVVYLYPEYAKRTTLAFLDRYTKRGGALMLEGEATRDFDGQPIGSVFARIAARARVKQFSVDRIAELGVAKSALRDVGGELEDGSVILTDLNSLETNQPKSFSVEVNGHRFSGAYVGVFALKAARDGSIEKVACGGCSALSRDGHVVLGLRNAADIVLHRTAAGGYDAVAEGHEGSNAVTLHR